MPLLQTPPSEVSITSLKTVFQKAGQVVTYEGDVIVRYGGTRLTADRVVAHYDENKGFAEGNVTLIDPDGTAHADRIEFSWNPAKRYARGDNVEIRVQGAILKARRADFQPGEWNLYDAEGTSCLRPKPVYYVTSDHVTVIPGKQAIVHEPHISLFGHFIAEAPTQRFQLTPAITGLRYPAPAYKFNRGFGLTWGGNILAGHNGTFAFDARTFQGSIPSAYAQYTHSYLPIEKATEIVAPRTDFAERFAYGYLDSVLVESPKTEIDFLNARRFSLSGGGQLNGSVVDRDRQTRYTKVEAVLERGQQEGGFGLLGQVRLQGLQREEEGMEPRVTFTGVAELPSYRLGTGLRTIGRLDASTFAGRTLYGWGRGMIGLTYAPAKWLRLSGGVFGSFDAGTPQFEIDPLYSTGGSLLRADVAFAGSRLSFLSKYDVHRGAYDNEFSLNQVIGCVEAYYIYRSYPSRSQIGLTLRVQPLLDTIRKRTDAYNGVKPVDKTNGLGPPTRP